MLVMSDRSPAKRAVLPTSAQSISLIAAVVPIVAIADCAMVFIARAPAALNQSSSLIPVFASHALTPCLSILLLSEARSVLLFFPSSLIKGGVCGSFRVRSNRAISLISHADEHKTTIYNYNMSL